ncbi:hypothetical protein [Rubritalea sp.]|uniref:hypothetical protein n=1 Tax=Rubritalea sp. TaxID=2109375 RepID=UPI003EF58C5C
MKGSPIIATAITILVLLGLYMGMRTILLPEDPKPQPGEHADHHGHNHEAPASNGGHDDSALETFFEIYFSSTPKSLSISQPSTEKEILMASEFDSPEWTGSGIVSLDGHNVELQIDVEWENPAEMNMIEIIVSPAKHASRSKTLRNDGNISDIADFAW